MLVTVAWRHWLVKGFCACFLSNIDDFVWTCWLKHFVHLLTVLAKLHLTLNAVNWSHILDLRFTFLTTTTSLTRTHLTLNTHSALACKKLATKKFFGRPLTPLLGRVNSFLHSGQATSSPGSLSLVHPSIHLRQYVCTHGRTRGSV